MAWSSTIVRCSTWRGISASSPRPVAPTGRKQSPPAIRLRSSRWPRHRRGQGRAPVPLHPRGLLPCQQLAQPRGPQRSTAPLAQHGGQSAGARHHPQDRQRGIRRRAPHADVIAVAALPDRAPAGAAHLERGHDQRWRQHLQRAGHDTAPGARGAQHGRRDWHPRSRGADRKPRAPAGTPSSVHRSRTPTATPTWRQRTGSGDGRARPHRRCRRASLARFLRCGGPGARRQGSA